MDERNRVPSDPGPGAEPTESKRTRATWEQPSITELPKLTDLTLLTGSGIPGMGNTGGSTVF
jgi:hypothetical protein